MDFSFSEEQLAIRAAIEKICAKFDAAYWLKRDTEGGFPDDFHQAIARDGWLGIAMPEQYGGAGLGITEAAIMLQAIAESGAGMSGASAVHMNIWGVNPVVVFGTDEQRQRWLPPLIEGRDKACFCVTEPDTGLDTTKLKTRAVKEGDGYRLSGRKIWISTAQVTNKMLILARTTPVEEVKKPTLGLSLFYTDMDRKHVEAREIPKMGRKAVDSNQVFIDSLKVPAADLIGEEGKGFEYILHGLNPERILIASEAIGKNQAIQHPLAQRWIELEAADLLVYKAAYLYDAGKPCGAEANAAKYLAGEAGFRACETAVMTHGGMGYAREYHVERYLRESLIPRIVPVSPQLILCYIAERVLGLPKSY
jgi:acyl-CoA dehydrogenase